MNLRVLTSSLCSSGRFLRAARYRPADCRSCYSLWPRAYHRSPPVYARLLRLSRPKPRRYTTTESVLLERLGVKRLAQGYSTGSRQPGSNLWPPESWQKKTNKKKKDSTNHTVQCSGNTAVWNSLTSSYLLNSESSHISNVHRTHAAAVVYIHVMRCTQFLYAAYFNLNLLINRSP